MTDYKQDNRPAVSMQETADTMNAAVHCFRSGDCDRATILCQEILQNDPENFNALCLHGVIAVHTGQLQAGIATLNKAVTLQPDSPVLQAELARAYKAAEQLGRAIGHYRNAITRVPDEASLHQELANALLESGEVDQAIVSYRHALTTGPSSPDTWNNLGIALKRQGQRQEALSCFRRAVEYDASHIDADVNIGLELKEQGHLDDALSHYSRILELHPGHANAHFQRSLCRLLCGDFQQGWPEYEWRTRKPEPVKAFLRKKPMWDGGSLESQTIWVGYEQGIGDQIMFASCLPELMRCAGHCIISCDQRLVNLFRRSFTGTTIIGHKEPDQRYQELDSEITTQISSGSVPRLLDLGTRYFPDLDRFLLPDPALIQRWKSRLESLGDGLKIGISWRGGSAPEAILDRSIDLHQWLPVLSVTDAHYVSLQYNKCSDEVAEMQSRYGITIHDWGDLQPLDDLDNFAACIACLDLVISIDNSTVHLAGALGAPVWVLLPFVPEWRWLMDTDRSYWYASVRLFRQQKTGDWNSVLSEIRRRLFIMESEGH